jgi:hypothetical protein
MRSPPNRERMSVYRLLNVKTTAAAAVLLLSLSPAAGCGTATNEGAAGTTAPPSATTATAVVDTGTTVTATGTAPVSLTGTSEATQGTGTTADQGAQGTSPTDITMPPPGSPNTAIYQALGWDNVYVVYWLQIQDGWAYIHAIPFTSTEGPTIDTRALLQQDAGGAWKVVERSANEGLLTDVGSVAEDQQIPQQFRSKHPDAPAGIFPGTRPEDTLVMDAVRAALGNPAYRFNVFVLNRSGDWAYTELRALSYQAGRIVETKELRALLQKTGGAWKVQQMGNGVDATTQQDFVNALRARFPDLPAGLLP